MNKFFEDIMPPHVSVISDYSTGPTPRIRFEILDDEGDKAIVCVSSEHIYVDTDQLKPASGPSYGVNFSLQMWRYFMCVMEDLQESLNKVPA